MSTLNYLLLIAFPLFAVFFLFAGWKNIKILIDDWEHIKYKTVLGRFFYIAGFVSGALLFTVLGFTFLYFLYITTSEPYLFLE
ncbi:hypothetical protein D0T84_18530 [Dysgonomonas sp. 521]|uniref:hypothetical protein n=1 Tax=Dysgonomonas sp. 521 TaxID=2302932 RepID=UPI0013D74AEF|nr:hypothetical protein [Dysgonomonas sp. 521]NDV96887.1 hypothetical protein [Dysgonomonas sp. 521]